jgi:hypothetical protein
MAAVNAPGLNSKFLIDDIALKVPRKATSPAPRATPPWGVHILRIGAAHGGCTAHGHL